MREHDPFRKAANLPVGVEGVYFVGEVGRAYAHTIADESPLGHGCSRYCGWVPTNDGCGIVWDDTEKFSGYATWLAFIVKHFINRWGYAVRGSVAWEGETVGDEGVLVVLNNHLVVAGSEHKYCAAGPVDSDMLFAGKFTAALVSAARLGGAGAVRDLLGSHACLLPR